MLFYFGIIILFFPFYSTPNIGGTGLAITYNIPIWIVASWFIAAGILLVINNKQIILPKQWLCFFAFPVIVVATSLLTEVKQPIEWFFRLLYIFSGLLFLFSLFQFKISQRVIDRCLFIIIIAAGLHSLIGCIQTISPELLTPWFPYQPDFVPRSLFQQINVQASFLATGLIISLYFISRPYFRLSSLLVKTITVVVFSLTVYILASSGSRIGFLSILLGIPLVLWSRYQPLQFHKKLLLILLMTSCFSLTIGQTGVNKTIDKMAQLKESSYSTSRITMYTIGAELVAKQPVYGYGIGGFLKAWNTQTTDFFLRHPEASLPESILHPHNELLFWMIEGGLLSLFGILAIIVGICIALYRSGFQRGGAYAAMLLPISLHTQVEHPFYVSSMHWFLWLFLIFIVLRHKTKVVNVSLSLSATRLVQCTAIFLAISVTIFMVNTTRAQTDLYKFIYEKDNPQPYLQLALNNIYFKSIAEQAAMGTMLYSSIANNNTAKVEFFEKWAKKQVYLNPKLQMYEDLVTASLFLRPEENGCDAIKAGLKMYAYNKKLQALYKACQ